MRLPNDMRARLRRTALSPRMAGLVTFSFSLLILGIVAYTVSLPSLIQASQRSERESLTHVIAKGMFGADGLFAEGGDAEDGKEGDSGSFGGEGSGSSGKGFRLGGVVIQGVIDGVVNDSHSNSGTSGTESGGGSGGGTSSGGSGSAGGGASDPNDPLIPEVPTEPPVTEEQEQHFYTELLGRANRINGYVEEINGVTSAFNNDCMADRSTREAHFATSKGLMYRLLDEYLYVRDGILVTNDSRYKPAQEDLIRMYRLLTEYVAVVANAWELNAGDAPGDINALLTDIREAQDSQLVEFQQVYNGFVL